MKSPGFIIHNDTIWPLEISLRQVGPLYWGLYQPGETFQRRTGAVWFTIRATIALDGKQHITEWDAIWPIASIVGSVAIGALTGGFGAFAAAGSIAASTTVTATITTGMASILVGGGVPALEAIVVSGAVLGALAPGAATSAIAGVFTKANASVQKMGCYAGPPWPFNQRIHQYHITGGPTLSGRDDGKIDLVPGALHIA